MRQTYASTLRSCNEVQQVFRETTVAPEDCDWTGQTHLRWLIGHLDPILQDVDWKLG